MGINSMCRQGIPIEDNVIGEALASISLGVHLDNLEFVTLGIRVWRHDEQI